MSGESRALGRPAVFDTVGRFARAHRVALVLIAIFGLSFRTLGLVDSASGVPEAWPAAGLLTGLLLVVDISRRPAILAQGLTLILLAHLLRGYDPASSIGFTLACALGSVVAVWRLLHKHTRPRVGLLDSGDVSRVIAAVTLGSGTAALVVGGMVAVTGVGSPWLAMLAVAGTHGASLLILLPFFLEAPSFPALAPSSERLVQSIITLGTTVAIFLVADAPPVVFAIMPMFAWLAFRGSLREASLLLTAVAVVATSLTAAHLGPVHGLMARYDLSAEMMTGYLQLFLLDCALVLLPLSVMATQQRRSAAHAATEHQTLERLVSAATGTAVLSVDVEGRVVVFNPGAEAMLGVSPQDATGEYADHFFTDEQLGRHAARLRCRPLFVEICAAASAAGDGRRLWTFTNVDGERRTMTMTITSVQDENGEPSGYLCVAEDVTEREARNKSLLTALTHERSAVERLRELEQVKADFVATVSHELRTPLTSMMGYVEVLEDGVVGELSADQRAVVNRVERNGRRLLLLVEDLLLLSQIEARELRLNPTFSDVRDAVRAACEALDPLLSTRHLELVVRVPDHPAVFEGDADHVERVLLNLLSNAVKFTPDGGRVELVVSELRDDISIVVLDTGMGIPEAEQDQLFTRFFRASTANRQAIQGTGLGLSIVQAIIDAHGGEISIASTEGVGTTVTASVPKTLPRGLGGARVPQQPAVEPVAAPVTGLGTHAARPVTEGPVAS